MTPSPPARSELAGAFVLRLGQALHHHGYDSARVEEVLGAVAESLGLAEPQVLSTPTSFILAFGSAEAQQVRLMRVEPGRVNLGHLARLDALTRDVLSGAIDPAGGLVQLEQLERRPPAFGPLITVLAYGLASAATARTLGGGLRELGAAAVGGTSIGLLSLLRERSRGVTRVFEPLGAFAASFLVGALAAKALPFATFLATLAGLITLVPGYTLTTGLRELAAGHLTSGAARLSASAIAFLGIIVGLALGDRLSTLAFGAPQLLAPIELPDWTAGAALFCSGLGFAVTLRAEPRDAGWVVLAGSIGVIAGQLGGNVLGFQLGTFLGAAAVGIAGNLFDRLLHRPAMILQVPGLLVLIPSSVGYRSLSALLDAQVISGVQTAFEMFFTTTALVTGLLLSNLVVPSPTLRARS